MYYLSCNCNNAYFNVFFYILSCLENGIKRSVLIVSDNLHVTFNYIRNQKFNFKIVLHFYFLL